MKALRILFNVVVTLLLAGVTLEAYVLHQYVWGTIAFLLLLFYIVETARFISKTVRDSKRRRRHYDAPARKISVAPMEEEDYDG